MMLGSNQGLLLWQSELLTSRLHRDPLYSTDTGNQRLNMELDLLCTAVLIGWDPPYPRIWAHIRGHYWSAKIDDITLPCWEQEFAYIRASNSTNIMRFDMNFFNFSTLTKRGCEAEVPEDEGPGWVSRLAVRLQDDQAALAALLGGHNHAHLLVFWKIGEYHKTEII